MKRAMTALAVTGAGVLWLVSFKTTPHTVASIRQAVGGTPEPAASAAPPSPGQPAAAPTPTPSGPLDGTYRGVAIDTPYGTVQVQVVLSGGRITDIKALQLPYDRALSAEISNVAEPMLRSETITAQSPRIDVVTGASYTSEAYAESVDSALRQAHFRGA